MKVNFGFVRSNKFLFATFLVSLLTNVVLVERTWGENHLISGNSWENPEVTYDISTTYSDTKTDIIQSAAAKWTDIDYCSFDLDYDTDSVNDWYYRDIDQLGLTSRTTVDGYLEEVDTVMDSSGTNWDTSGDPSSTEYDFYSISTHEFGHWLRLLDDYDHNDGIMDAYWSKGETKDDFSSEERNAAQSMY